MAITGIHTLLYSPAAEEVRATMRDIFGWEHVDAGNGWLIFTTPPAEMAVHPGDQPAHEISLLCDDLEATMEDLRTRGIEFVTPVEDRGFGIASTMRLAGGVELLLYEPRHPTAI